MARVNPWSLAAPPRPVESRTFTDPAYPDKPVTVWLRALSASEAYQALEIADALISEYLPGDGEGVPFPLVGEGVTLTRKMIYDMASMEVAQPLDAPERYDARELIAFSEVMPAVFDQITEFYLESERKHRASRGNASRAATDRSSEKSSGSDGAPNSPPVPTLPSGPSTSD